MQMTNVVQGANGLRMVNVDGPSHESGLRGVGLGSGKPISYINRVRLSKRVPNASSVGLGKEQLRRPDPPSTQLRYPQPSPNQRILLLPNIGDGRSPVQYNYTGDDLSDIDEFPTESSSEQPIVSPNVADADSQDCPPAEEVRSGKKRKRTGAQRAAMKAAVRIKNIYELTPL